jgi:hypothetical protein
MEQIITYEDIYSLGFEYIEDSYGFAEYKFNEDLRIIYKKYSNMDILLKLEQYFPDPEYTTKSFVESRKLNIKTKTELEQFIKYLTT